MKPVPFSYGKVPDSIDFTNRVKEISQLKNNFEALTNTIIISPRRWGKSSLVRTAGAIITAEHRDMRIIHLDIFNIRNEVEFYQSLANQILKATASTWEEFAASAKKFLSNLVPRISFAPDDQAELSFSIGWQELKQQPDEILNLAEKIAEEKKLRLILCIDEFQNIGLFDDAAAFQRKLRSHWQQHRHVAYCLYGSKRHMLTDIFTNPSMPFYKFGDLFFLQKIASVEWISFIVKRFADTGKEIPGDIAALICTLVDNHPYYVQQLSQQAWFRTTHHCTGEIVNIAYESVIDQLSLLFANTTEGLNSRQLELLRAIINGEEQLSAQKTLRAYRLGTSANVVRLKESLIQNDVLDDMNGKLSFLDPLYRYWLENRFFGAG
ncbi:MAG TPA: hypothetical protein VL093_06960 [Flavipsychrobacter sp.]|nr:hypothetical protein [Flavipsychrobacter sp.]